MKRLQSNDSPSLGDALGQLANKWNALRQEQIDVLAGICGLTDTEVDICDISNAILASFGNAIESSRREKAFCEALNVFLNEISVNHQQHHHHNQSPISNDFFPDIDSLSMPPAMEVMPYPFDELDRLPSPDEYGDKRQKK